MIHGTVVIGKTLASCASASTNQVEKWYGSRRGVCHSFDNTNKKITLQTFFFFSIDLEWVVNL
jgi:hypothetical protein